MAFNHDYSKDKPDIRSVIPAGHRLLLQMTYTPGGVGDDGALTASKETDAEYLKAEFTVLRGPFKGRKIWSNMTVSGGKVDEKGNSIAAGITRKTIRLILDSSQGLKSTDETPEAAAKRVIKSFKDLQGRKFVAQAKVEKAQNGYPEKNGLGQVLTVDMKNYPTEADLDAAPTATASSTSAAPPPVWTGADTPATPAPGRQEQAQPQLVAAQPTPASAAPPPAPIEQDNGLPKWAAA